MQTCLFGIRQIKSRRFHIYIKNLWLSVCRVSMVNVHRASLGLPFEEKHQKSYGDLTHIHTHPGRLLLIAKVTP